MYIDICTFIFVLKSNNVYDKELATSLPSHLFSTHKQNNTVKDIQLLQSHQIWPVLSKLVHLPGILAFKYCPCGVVLLRYKNCFISNSIC